MCRFAFFLPVAFAAASLAACEAQTERPQKVIERVALPQAESSRQPSDESDWQLVWSDEFEGTEIDRAKWTFDVDCWGGGNEEQQCYRDDPQNAAIEDGKLIITARREEHTGPAYPPHMRGNVENPDAQATKPYTSARLTTRGKQSWKYGRIEVRTKLPQGQGTWPAIWMLPEGNSYGGWAASGEIDIMEAVNLGVDCDDCPGGKESTVLGTLHFGTEWPDNALNSSEIYVPAVLDGFRTFGIVWSPGRIEWSIDGQVYAVKEADSWWSANSKEADAPFDQPFHLILNLAIGGGLPEERNGGGIDTGGFPKHFEIDWVRVWKCDRQTADIPSCAGGN
ncbi:glycoside hydrolase family 16 protein [Sphingorhabdus sp. Alg239-R122]|uniref:glycoside hydrolase family 16 protein n=1 Tax=Sphingorhabdus sp. Alg239-R122 TaxID=2305989 RepID=UPI0013DAC005|nr:glycoside hydrolase family 16 protein [Sphingorhabdus sp. Alg239-R122]